MGVMCQAFAMYLEKEWCLCNDTAISLNRGTLSKFQYRQAL